MPGVSIHSEHPFLPPPDQREAGRRLRARLGGTVTLWTAGAGTGREDRAGLTVGSLMLGDGPAWQLLALLDPDADLTGLLLNTRTALVHLLTAGQQNLSEAFAGRAPAPGGPFTLADWEQTSWGPRITGTATWAGVRLSREPEPVGWSLLVCCEVEDAGVGDEPLLTYRRGRYGEG